MRRLFRPFSESSEWTYASSALLMFYAFAHTPLHGGFVLWYSCGAFSTHSPTSTDGCSALLIFYTFA